MKNSKAYALVLTALLTALTAISARIAIPVPFTTILVTPQVLCVLLCGLVLGPKYAALSQVCYLLLGFIGLPVFSKGGGFSYVLDPSFGYALGFLPAAWVAGALRKRVHPVAACALGVCALYAVAMTYILLLLKALGNPIPAPGVFLSTYFALFFPIDLLKGILAWLCFRPLSRRKLVLSVSMRRQKAQNQRADAPPQQDYP